METIKETINMKEKLYTIPLNDAVNENDECPFCFIERQAGTGHDQFCARKLLVLYGE